jgi:prevent-host-death family protein
MASEIPATQARAEFADLVNRVVYGGERIVVTRHGKPIAALVPAADLERLDQLEALERAEQSSPTIVRLPTEPANQPIGSQPSHIRRFDIAAQHRPPGGSGSGGPGLGRPGLGGSEPGGR